jgi:serine phosphatase RsbU (regulator of sigma subunit)
LVEHPAVSISAHYDASGELLEVGGDWYDTYQWPSGRIAAMVGDVVGHSVEAAAQMGRLRAAVAALLPGIDERPGPVIDALATFAAGPDGSDYLTACCVVIDPATRLVRYCLAGHPPVLVVSPDGTATWLAEAASQPLGAVMAQQPTVRREGSLVVGPGSTVILYSDGLIERRHESLDDGLRRLEEAAVRLVGTGATDLSHAIANEMTSSSPSNDDVVVVTLQLRTPGATAD